MRNRAILTLGFIELAAVGVGYVGWRVLLKEFPEAVAKDDAAVAESLANDLFDAGELGREIKVLTALLAACLAGLWIMQRYRPD